MYVELTSRSPSNEGSILPETRTPPSRKLPTCRMKSQIENSTFAQLRLRGLLSAELVLCVPHLLTLQAMIPADTCTLDLPTAKDLLTYIWYCARTLVSCEDFATSRLEHSVRQALLIFYYSCVWNNPQDGVGWMVGSMQSHTSSVDAAWLTEDYPEVLLWFCLTAGDFAKDLSREWWLDLLVSVRHATGIRTFFEARQVVQKELVWTHRLDERAENFWNQTTSIIRELQLPWQKEP